MAAKLTRLLGALQDFELDLEGSQTLRVLCYSREGKDKETLLGKGALELRSVWLTEGSHSYTISLGTDLSLVMALQYCSREQTLSRYIEPKTSGVFGIRIETLAK